MPKEKNGHGDTFFKKMNNVPVMNREEELRLAKQYLATQDPAIARKLVEGHLRLVVKIAYKCSFGESVLPDLIQEGCLGLMKAVTKYDPSRGVRLSSYAVWWIRAQIFQYILSNSRSLRVATTFAQRKLFFALRREQEKLAKEGHGTNTKELARRLNVSEGDVIEMGVRLNARDVRLDTAASGDSSRADGCQELASASLPPDELFAQHELQAAVRKKVAVLNKDLENREKMIFDRRLNAEDPMTLQDIARKCGISRERARQIEERLKQRLRPQFESMVDNTAHAA